MTVRHLLSRTSGLGYNIFDEILFLLLGSQRPPATQLNHPLLHDSATMRSPGSLSWAGINNTQFWIDPDAGIGAVLLMQYRPFHDEVAIETLQGLEALVYEHLQ